MIGVDKSKLLKICPNSFKLDQIGPNRFLVQIDSKRSKDIQIGPNKIHLAQIGPNRSK